MLRVTVCEKQVMPLAIMAPLMEKGSMVQTTNTMNKKKDTWRQEGTKCKGADLSEIKLITFWSFDFFKNGLGYSELFYSRVKKNLKQTVYSLATI